MSNASFREMNRRQYLQWGWESAAGVAALIWWQWQTLAVWMPPVERVGARAVALARLARLVFPPPMLGRMHVAVDMQGHVSTIAAILQVIQSPRYSALRFDGWLYLTLPPAVGILAAVVLLMLAARLRKAKERQEHVRGAGIDDCT